MWRVISKSWKDSSRKQKGFDQVKRVLSNLTGKTKNFRYPDPIHAIRAGLWSLVGLFLYVGCSPPDLQDPETFEHAIREAVPVEKLTRKRMYGMLMLYVDKDENPYTGWVRKDWKEGELKELGYLEDGQKQGTWMSWHANGVKESEIHWENDQMHGAFEVWHINETVNTVGQTKDGEVDGEWKRYYSSGQLAEIALNQIGHLVRIKVWHPDGTPCKDSHVEGGNGAYNMYEENGTLKERRVFRSGVQTKETEGP